MANNDMRMNISLSKENVKLLKALSTLEKRAYSKEILHMMEFYLDKNPELKKKLEESGSEVKLIQEYNEK